MNLLDHLVDSAFTKRSDDVIVYSPYGFSRNGRVIKNQIEKNRIRIFHKYQILFSAIGGLVAGILVYITGFDSSVVGLICIIVGCNYYYRWKMLKDLPICSVKTKRNDRMRNASRVFGNGYCWVWGFTSALTIVVTLSLPVLLNRTFADLWVAELIIVSFCLVNLLMSIYLYKIKNSGGNN